MVLQRAQGGSGSAVHLGGLRAVGRGQHGFVVCLHLLGKAGFILEAEEELFHIERRFTVWEGLEVGFHGGGVRFAERQGKGRTGAGCNLLTVRQSIHVG
jgi:hypothetical protein